MPTGVLASSDGAITSPGATSLLRPRARHRPLGRALWWSHWPCSSVGRRRGARRRRRHSDDTGSPTSTTAVTTTSRPRPPGSGHRPGCGRPVTVCRRAASPSSDARSSTPTATCSSRWAPTSPSARRVRGGLRVQLERHRHRSRRRREAWGWNTVRAPSSATSTAPVPPSTSSTPASTRSSGVHPPAGRRDGRVPRHHRRQPRPDRSQGEALFPFWDRLATKWKDNPYVWFNLQRTPGDHDRCGRRQLARPPGALGRLRAIAPTGIFVADIPGAAQGLGTLTGDDPITRLGDGQCNVFYGWHSYGAVGNDDEFGSPNDWDNEAASPPTIARCSSSRQRHPDGHRRGRRTIDARRRERRSADLEPIRARSSSRSPRVRRRSAWWHGTGDSGVFLTYS